MSGIWTHEHNQLGKLLSPGFYLFGSPIPIPKLVAVPLTLGLFGGISYFLGQFLEKQYKANLRRKKRSVQQEVNPPPDVYPLYLYCFQFLFCVWGALFHRIAAHIPAIFLRSPDRYDQYTLVLPAPGNVAPSDIYERVWPIPCATS